MPDKNNPDGSRETTQQSGKGDPPAKNAGGPRHQANEEKQNKGFANNMIDKGQDYVRGDKKPGAVDKAIDKAQEKGMVDKAVAMIKGKLKGGKK